MADYIGDSLGLAQNAEKTNADIIVFAGVHFMAETAKILNPAKKVLLPDLKAGCSLSDSAPPPSFKAFKEKYPGYKVISYINCSAGIKALSDIICTSFNAQKIVESLPTDQPIIFAPDKNWGAYINKKSGRNMFLWNGACMVHEIFAVFFGHLFPVFLKFRAGKGVATAGGVLFALDPLLGLAVLGTWLFVAFAFRYSSLAAVLGAALAPVYQVLMHGGDGRTLVVGVPALALIGKHWQNLQRLLAGQESRIGSKKKHGARRRRGPASAGRRP